MASLRFQLFGQRITAQCAIGKKNIGKGKNRKGRGKKKSAGVFDGSVAGAAHLTHDMLLDEIQPEKKILHNHADSMLTRGTACLQSALITEEQTTRFMAREKKQ